ncbi:MAG: hypothetical protein ACE15E_16570 [Acidobacteriota bacterium]
MNGPRGAPLRKPTFNRLVTNKAGVFGPEVTGITDLVTDGRRLALSDTWTLSPPVTNELRFSYFRRRQNGDEGRPAGALYSRATGDPGSPLVFPLNAVRWLTPPRQIAALVTHSSHDRFSAELFAPVRALSSSCRPRVSCKVMVTRR